MFAQMFRRVAEALAPVPVDDCRAFRGLTKAHPTPDARPGTMGEARKAVVEALETLERVPYGSYDYWLPERLARIMEVLDAHDRYHHDGSGSCRCKRRWRTGNATAEVGPVNQVCRLGDIDHFVGMEVRTGPDGWSLEHLELLDNTLEVLRHNGKVAGVQYGHVLRMESRGGIHYV